MQHACQLGHGAALQVSRPQLTRLVYRPIQAAVASVRGWDVTDMYAMALVMPLPFGSDKDIEATLHNMLCG